MFRHEVNEFEGMSDTVASWKAVCIKCPPGHLHPWGLESSLKIPHSFIVCVSIQLVLSLGNQMIDHLAWDIFENEKGSPILKSIAWNSIEISHIGGRAQVPRSPPARSWDIQ